MKKSFITLGPEFLLVTKCVAIGTSFIHKGNDDLIRLHLWPC